MTIVEENVNLGKDNFDIEVYELDQNNNIKNDFYILSIQRNFKILGIFVRLYKRDGKSNYLKL